MHSLFKFLAGALVGLLGVVETASAASAIRFTGSGLTPFVFASTPGANGPVEHEVNFAFEFSLPTLDTTLAPTLMSDAVFGVAEAELTLTSTLGVTGGPAVATFDASNVRVEIQQVIAGVVNILIDGLDAGTNTGGVSGAADYFFFGAQIDLAGPTFRFNQVTFQYQTDLQGAADPYYTLPGDGSGTGTFTVQYVPVPAAAPLMIGALAALGLAARRRRRAAAAA